MLFLQLYKRAHRWSLAVRSPFRRGFQSELAIRREWAIKFDLFVCSIFLTRSTWSVPRLLVAAKANFASISGPSKVSPGIYFRALLHARSSFFWAAESIFQWG